MRIRVLLVALVSLAAFSQIVPFEASAADSLLIPRVRPQLAPESEPTSATDGVIATGVAIANALQPCNEVEPNEQPAQATPLSVPGNCGGSVSSTDASSIAIDYDGFKDGIEDLFVLNLPAAAKLKVDLTYTSKSADLDLFLFTVSGNTIRFYVAANHDAVGSAEGFELSSPIPAGTYYLGVSAFTGSSPYTLTVTAPGYSETCTPNDTSVCLNNGRFRVTTDWQTPAGQSGKGQSVLLTPDTGYFWFFDQGNVEVVIKVLDACGFSERFWVFAGGLTDVKVVLSVNDTLTGATKQYTNPLSTPFEIITDTDAFATCNPGCTISVSPTSQQFGSAGGSGSVAVTSGTGCGWNATTASSWLTINSGASGSGNGTVAYSVAANSTTSARTGKLSVSGHDVTISQAAGSASCSYSVSPTSHSVAASAGSGSITVTTQAGCAWTATSNNSWLTITSGASGSGGGTVSYSVAANSGSSSRSGTMTVAGKTVTITQAGSSSSCTFTVNYTSRPFTWCGGDDSYTVTKADGCAFGVSSNVSWIVPVLVTSRTGGTTGFGSFSVLPNQSASPREGTITIAGHDYTVTQSGKGGSGTYDGTWTGTTNGGRAVDVCVADNAIQTMRITVRLSAGGMFTCTTPIVRTDPMTINGSSFSGTVAAYPEISNVYTTVNGSFPNSTSMSASWGAFTDSWFIFCGSSVGFGTGGTTLASGTFTATKQ